MSTVPEAIAASHCGLPVVALSLITNMAAGMAGKAGWTGPRSSRLPTGAVRCSRSWSRNRGSVIKSCQVAFKFVECSCIPGDFW